MNRNDFDAPRGERGVEDVFSLPVKAGKRTYFFDVKTTKGHKDYYLTITESKRHTAPDGTVSYDKHKIFLYKEDFEKFAEGLQNAVKYVKDECFNGEIPIKEYPEHDSEKKQKRKMYFSDYQTAAAFIKERIGQRQPCVGIVLGSGLGALADAIEEPIVLPYKEIPNFPVSTAIGHKGNLICGTIAGHCVLAMQGRFHFYEGYTMQQVTFPMRVMKVMGIETLFVSNAAGGLNPSYKVGDLMMIKDHINMLPNPLIGKNMEEFGPRFPDMTRPYDPELRKLAKEIAARVGIDLKEGVYYGDTGPTYETPAEYKFKFIAGADAVGMSTVPEVIVARHCGMRVFGVSVISNEAHGDFSDDYVNDGDDVVEAANAASKNMIKLFTELIRTL